jgi:MFS family permease
MSGDTALLRERRTLAAAGFANGPYELVDFILPLFAGAALGASATQVGLLAATEMAVSMLARPVAGVLADRTERLRVAAVGAALYAASLVGYALAATVSVAYAAAVLGGAGGALFWVAVRATTGERLAEDSTVFARLLSSEETGSWIAFVGGMTLIGAVGYRGVFLLGALSCLVAAGVLLTAPTRPPSADPGDQTAGRRGLGAVGRRLRPMLLAVVVTMAAEAAIALLLLLHLQRGFGLDVVSIALVFLPGALVMSVLPPHLHRLVLRYGRARVLAVASVSSALFAASLAPAPNPLVLAALWILSGAAWAAVIPVQQAVVAEASGVTVGRGMGLYESAVLLGSLIGVLAAGLLYDGSSWPVACTALAALILSGAVIVPRAVRAVGVPDIPVEAPEPVRPAPPAPPGLQGPSASPSVAQDATAAGPAAGLAPITRTVEPPRNLLRDLASHVALYLGVQVVLAVIGLSWLLDVVTGRDPDHEGFANLLHSGGRVWAVVLAVDIVWTAWKLARSRR